MKKVLTAVSCLALMLSSGMLVAQDKGAKAGKTTGKAAAGNVAKGKEVFESYCVVCHSADTEERKMGPGLKGLTKHAKIVNDEPMNDANLMKFINEGGNSMPAFADQLKTTEKADILAFLKSL
jgi:mono/diheme cytochrome c family protein